MECHPSRRRNVVQARLSMRHRCFGGDAEQALAGEAIQACEKQRDTAGAAVEIGPERAMHDTPGIVDELHGIAEPVASFSRPQRLARQPPAKRSSGFEKCLVLARAHAARLSANT